MIVCADTHHALRGRTLLPSDPMSTPRMTDHNHISTGFNPAALLAAAAFPGAGHMLGGDIRRGAHIAAGVLGLFAGGVFIGGICVIDRHDNNWWFIAHALVGPPAFAVDYIHQTQYKSGTTLAGKPAVPPPSVAKYRRSIGKAYDLGTLFAAVGGMVNLIAIIDAGFPTRRRKERA